MNTLICPRSLFEELFVNLLASPADPSWLVVGKHVTGPDREWLVRAAEAAARPRDQPHFRVMLTAEPPAQARLIEATDGLEGWLWLADGPYKSQIWGLVRIEDRIETLDHLFLPGAGMFAIDVSKPNV